MRRLIFDAADEQATEQFGAALAAAIEPGTIIALCGTLGAGKTRLVQAMAVVYGIAREDVVSPTFVLWQTYRGSRVLHHLDAYRIRDLDEFQALGVEELYASQAVTVIEWADRIADALPEGYLQIDIEVTGPTSRRFSIQAVGNQALPDLVLPA